MATQADRIRRFVIENLNSLATHRDGRLCICARDVVRGMGLVNQTPSVCSALESVKFQQEAALKWVDRIGPRRSTTTVFVYEPAAGAETPPAPQKTPVVLRPPASPTPNGLRTGVSHSGRTELPRVDLCLVSCVSDKLCCAAPAKDLYVSPLFTKTRSLVTAMDCPWFILSAKYGLVAPERHIEPYNRTLKGMSVDARRAWANEVWKCLEPHLRDVGSVAVFAGNDYREFLVPRLRHRSIQVHVLMQSIGRQLRWLNEQLEGIEAP